MFALAEQLGGMTATELLDRMDWEEMRHWIAYGRIRERNAKQE